MSQNLLSTPFRQGVGLGLLAPNIKRVAALGHTIAMATTDAPRTIWPGTTMYPFLTSAQTLEVVSTSTSDTAAGTGAQTLQLTLLDANYAEQVVNVTLNGTTPVTISGGPYMRINFGIVLTAGSTRYNVGDINVRVSGGGTVIGIMTATESYLNQCVYTVPAGYTLNVEQYHATVIRTSGGTDVTISDDIQLFNGPRYLPFQFASNSGGYTLIPIDPSYVATEKTDISLRIMTVSANGTATSGAIIGTLYKTSVL